MATKLVSLTEVGGEEVFVNPREVSYLEPKEIGVSTMMRICGGKEVVILGTCPEIAEKLDDD